MSTARVKLRDRVAQSAVAMRRGWAERSAIGRALTPAWPVAFGAAVAAFALTGPDQGREALLVTLAAEPDDVESVRRYWSFIVGLAVFSAGLLCSGLFVLAVQRAARAPTRPGETPIPADPVSQSVPLRTVTALVLAAIPSFAILWHVAEPFAADGVFPANARGALALGVFIAVTGLLWTLERPGTAWQAGARRLWTEGDRGRDGVKKVLARVSYHIAGVLRLSAERPQRYGLAALAACGFLLVTRTEGVMGARDLEASGIMLAPLLLGALYVLLRSRAMRILESRVGRLLIVDGRFRRTYRNGSFVLMMALLALLWAPALGWDSHAAIGPATILLAGLSLIVSFLIWLVRNAIEAPAPRQESVGRNVLARLARPLERVQSQFTPYVLFGVGVLLWWIDAATAWLATLDITDALARIAIGAALVAVGAVVVMLALSAAHILTVDRQPITVSRLRKFPGLLTGGIERVRLASIVVLAPFLLSTLGENHHVAVTAGARPPTVDDYAAAWLKARVAQTPGEPVQAVIVLAEGGGIRAASHVGHLLSALEQVDAQSGAGRPLFDQVYAMSGVSGGAVGLSIYLAARAEAEGDAAELAERVRRTLRHDHLSALFGGMFASDLLTTLAPVDLWLRALRVVDPEAPAAVPPGDRGFWNRADFFETGLQRAFSQGHDDQVAWFEAPIAEVVEAASGGAGRIGPLVLFGAFSADDGTPVVASNVLFDGCGDGQSGEGLLSIESCFPQWAPRVLPLSAAGHLSARFPGSNPPGLVETPIDANGAVPRDPALQEGWRERRFVDGGYFDNSGAAAAIYAVDALRRAARVQGVVLSLKVLHVYTREYGAPDLASRAPAVTFSEINTPFGAVMGARAASGRLPLLSFCRRVTGDLASVCTDLLGEQSKYRAHLDAAPAPPIQHRCLGDVLWAPAALPIPRRRTDENYLLLGWTLRPQSHDYVEAQMAELAPRLHGALRQSCVLTAPLPAAGEDLPSTSP